VVTTLWFLPVRLDFAPVELKQQIDGIDLLVHQLEFPDDLCAREHTLFAAGAKHPAGERQRAVQRKTA
jgi:hypothetical protein